MCQLDLPIVSAAGTVENEGELNSDYKSGWIGGVQVHLSDYCTFRLLFSWEHSVASF